MYDVTVWRRAPADKNQKILRQPRVNMKLAFLCFAAAAALAAPVAAKLNVTTPSAFTFLTIGDWGGAKVRSPSLIVKAAVRRAVDVLVAAHACPTSTFPAPFPRPTAESNI